VLCCVLAAKNQNLTRELGGLDLTFAAAKDFAGDPFVMDAVCQLFFNIAENNRGCPAWLEAALGGGGAEAPEEPARGGARAPACGCVGVGVRGLNVPGQY
jgi:hypothetical protein